MGSARAGLLLLRGRAGQVGPQSATPRPRERVGPNRETPKPHEGSPGVGPRKERAVVVDPVTSLPKEPVAMAASANLCTRAEAKAAGPDPRVPGGAVVLRVAVLEAPGAQKEKAKGKVSGVSRKPMKNGLKFHVWALRPGIVSGVRTVNSCTLLPLETHLRRGASLHPRSLIVRPRRIPRTETKSSHFETRIR